MLLGSIILAIIMITDGGYRYRNGNSFSDIYSINSCWHLYYIVAFTAFVSSLLTLAIIVLSICEYDTFGIGLIVALIVAAILAVGSYIYYKYSFVIVTAFTGGLAAAIGITFLVTGNTLESYIDNILCGESVGSGMMIVITLVLTVAGSCVQISGMKKQKEPNRKIEAGKTISSIFSQDLMDEIKKYPITFYVPVAIYVLFGVIHITNIISWNSVWIHIIDEGIALGCSTYAAFRLSKRYCIIIQIAYALGYLLQYIDALSWHHSASMGLFGMTLIWGVVYFIKKQIKEEPWKPLLVIIAANLVFVFILPFFEFGYYFNVYTLISIVVSILCFAYMCIIYDKTNLFRFTAKNNGLPNIDNSSYSIDSDKKLTNSILTTIDPVGNPVPAIEPVTIIESSCNVNKMSGRNMLRDNCDGARAADDELKKTELKALSKKIVIIIVAVSVVTALIFVLNKCDGNKVSQSQNTYDESITALSADYEVSTERKSKDIFINEDTEILARTEVDVPTVKGNDALDHGVQK